MRKNNYLSSNNPGTLIQFLTNSSRKKKPAKKSVGQFCKFQTNHMAISKTSCKGRSSTKTSRVNSDKKMKKTKRSNSSTNWKSYKPSSSFSNGKTKRKNADFIPESFKYRKKPANHLQDNKQNVSYPSNQEILNASGLLKANKPTKINFLNKVTFVYELALSATKLPQFIDYFLGEALYLVYKSSRQTQSGSAYDWKLEEFKEICANIYNNSEEQDLKYFMSIKLPEINRWCTGGKGLGQGLTVTTQMMSRLNTISSKPFTSIEPSHKNKQILTMDRLRVDERNKTNESRFTFMEGSRGIQNRELGTRERLNYFKCLVRKQPKPIQICKDVQYDAIDRVQKKLDDYFNKALGAIGRTNHIV